MIIIDYLMDKYSKIFPNSSIGKRESFRLEIISLVEESYKRGKIETLTGLLGNLPERRNQIRLGFSPDLSSPHFNESIGWDNAIDSMQEILIKELRK